MSPFSEAAILRWPTECSTGCPRGCAKLPSLLTELTGHVCPAEAVWCLSRQIPERLGMVPIPLPEFEGHLFPRAMANVEARCGSNAIGSRFGAVRRCLHAGSTFRSHSKRHCLHKGFMAAACEMQLRHVVLFPMYIFQVKKFCR